MKKILFITYEYPTYTPFGGIAFYYAKVAQILASQDFEVTVVSAKLNNIESRSIECNKRSNLKEIFICCRGFDEFEHLAYKWLIAKKSGYDLLEMCEKSRFFLGNISSDDIKKVVTKIIIRVHGTTILAALYNKPTKYVQKVIYLYNSIFLNKIGLKMLKYFKVDKYKLGKLNYREYVFVNKANVITAPSHLMGNFINRYWLNSKKTIVFPNPSQYGICEYEKKPFDKTAILVSYVNRLQYLKGFDLFHRLSKDFSKKPNIHFSAFGSYSQLNIGSTKNEISETIDLKDFVNANELIEVYKKSHVVIVPSRFESFSNVALEAMGFGCIVIVSDNMGMAEHITHGLNGFVFQSDKYESLETVFEEIMGMEGTELERVSFNAYQTALKLSENKELLEFYQSV